MRRFTGLAVLIVSLTAVSSAQASSYTYDSLGRIVSFTAENGRTTNYAYDAAGNRQTVIAPTSAGARASNSSTVVTKAPVKVEATSLASIPLLTDLPDPKAVKTP